MDWSAFWGNKERWELQSGNKAPARPRSEMVAVGKESECNNRFVITAFYISSKNREIRYLNGLHLSTAKH